MSDKILIYLKQGLARALKNPRLYIYALFIVAALIGLEEVVDDVFSDPKEGDFESMEFDKLVYSLLNKYESSDLTAVMRDLTAFGSVSIICTLTVFSTVALTLKRRFFDLLYLTVTVISSTLAIVSLKIYFNRERPSSNMWLMDAGHTLSFPSGHTMGATTIFLAMTYIFTKNLNNWKHELCFYVLSLLIIFSTGLSRIYLGVHYPTDVLGGFTAGAAIVFLYALIFHAIEKNKLK